MEMRECCEPWERKCKELEAQVAEKDATLKKQDKAFLSATEYLKERQEIKAQLSNAINLLRRHNRIRADQGMQVTELFKETATAIRLQNIGD